MADFSTSELDQLIGHFDFAYQHSRPTTPTVAISSCLNGDAVRYDGQRKSFSAINLLKDYLQFCNICPEVGAGMPVPRPPVQLVRQDQQQLRVLEKNNPQVDVSQRLERFSEQSQRQFPKEIVGYIFQSKSPSCGINSTPIFNQNNESIAIGSGIQAAYFLKTMPHLAFADEQQLADQKRCDQFIFLCFLLQDLSTAISEQGLEKTHRHYDFLISRFSSQQQRQLIQALKNQTPASYSLLFKQAAEVLIYRGDFNLESLKR